MASEMEILAPPSDGVACMRFSQQGNKSHLLVASWDAGLRVYDSVRLRVKVDMEQPVLACCYGGSDVEAFAGGLECALKQVDLNTKQITTVGQHDAAVRNVEYSKEYGLAVSGGWDGAVKVWDIRNGNNAKIHEAKHDGKVFGMDLRSHLLVVATSKREVGVYDLRNFNHPLEKKESPLKYQTRCVRVFPDLQGYAMGSIEGRVALEYFGDATNDDKKRSYAFKCHRGKVDDQVVIYPINTIAFHPTFGTFATGGCDGAVNLWDGDNKKRITHLRKFPTSISALDFNHDGSVLAIASSYTYEEGEKDHPNDAIFLHSVQTSEVQPKKKA
uniref:Anaphase-promoting complex subunit 4 WD40 domain-containing protein n=1 Tax=Globisporangium ultimum (strain ATCC 200006 / CBS 805.95 / DAOM BR144) TaxID=431595 RepID=K3WCF8_GLOUD